MVLEGQDWFIKFGFLNVLVSWRSKVRGYVADMRVQNPNVCNSFEGLENAENAIAVNSKKASIEVIILDDGEDEDVVELTTVLEELTRDEEKASAANGVTTDTLRKTEKRTRVKISSLKLKMMEKNSIDKPRRLEKPLVSHLALWETLRLKSKIMITLQDFLSLHET
ncbi:hypothetical protein POM88_034314 [Heracleum sosnowskyi]|uniref:Uncharacterized protein n=1 Tax=Heracleum sosnowskyi TaxID=360622 RepID=A0AAD8MCW3_9APIA|nr:hypothetical protein POM88_034314 [Heracleum sosnowskyi]